MPSPSSTSSALAVVLQEQLLPNQNDLNLRCFVRPALQTFDPLRCGLLKHESVPEAKQLAQERTEGGHSQVGIMAACLSA